MSKCAHREVVPVETAAGGVVELVAYLCLDCDAQLPTYYADVEVIEAAPNVLTECAECHRLVKILVWRQVDARALCEECHYSTP